MEGEIRWQKTDSDKRVNSGYPVNCCGSAAESVYADLAGWLALFVGKHDLSRSLLLTHINDDDSVFAELIVHPVSHKAAPLHRGYNGSLGWHTGTSNTARQLHCQDIFCGNGLQILTAYWKKISMDNLSGRPKRPCDPHFSCTCLI